MRAFCSPPAAASFLTQRVSCLNALPKRRRRRPGHEPPRALAGTSLPPSKPLVCCGKFDAFHVGHLELARQAATRGAPVLLSFSGMAEALGWPPRAPVVAPVERPGILRGWGGLVGRQVGYKIMPFESVREMQPEDFVSMLREELGAAGVVCGPDWRFGHMAKGDVALLRNIADSLDDFEVCVVDPITIETDNGIEKQVVSSTAVRRAIAAGDVAAAAQMMARAHRVVGFLGDIRSDFVTVEDMINQIPGDGTYQALVRVPGQSEPVRSFVKISRPGGEDPMLHGPDVEVKIFDANTVYCLGCEVYVDFEERVS